MTRGYSNRRAFLSVAALFALAALNSGPATAELPPPVPPPLPPHFRPREPPPASSPGLGGSGAPTPYVARAPSTPADHAAVARAEQKRERRRAKRLALANAALPPRREQAA
jgi:hypothetical protein